MKYPNLRKNHCFLFVLLLISSCKVDELEPKTGETPKMCVIVKDFITNLPVKGAAVSAYVEAADGSSLGLYGVSDENGNTFLEYYDYIYLNEINVYAAGYERACKTLIADRNISTTREIFLLKKTGVIKFHAINQPPAYMIDSMMITTKSNLDECFSSGFNYQFVGLNIDSILNHAAIAGTNSIHWELYRYNTLIKDSTFNVIAPMGDTVFAQINY